MTEVEKELGTTDREMIVNIHYHNWGEDFDVIIVTSNGFSLK